MIKISQDAREAVIGAAGLRNMSWHGCELFLLRTHVLALSVSIAGCLKAMLANSADAPA